MKYIIYLLLASSLYAQSCYTVQILSSVKNEKSRELLSKTQYPKSCKLMEIGKTLTVRCGCYNKIKKAKRELPKLKRKYKHAYITSTYRYRFDDIEKKPKEKISTKIQKEPFKIYNKLIANKTKKIKHKKKKRHKDKYVKKRDSNFFYKKYLRSFRGSYQSSKLAGKYGTAYLDYKYRFGGQVSYDFGYINEAPNSYTSGEWRRVRIYHKGSFFDDKLFYELEYSFTGKNNLKDIYIAYKDNIESLDTDYRVKFGNIKIPFSLETYSSSKNITFMERALTDSFADNRKLGSELLLSKNINKNHINIFASIYSNSLDDRKDNLPIHNGYASRFTYAYKFSKNHLLSVGGAIMHRNMNGDFVKFNQSSESDLMRKKYVSVKIRNVDTTSKKNIEALYINKAYSLQGEYVTDRVDALKGIYNFDAYYLQGSYFLFGKGRRFDISDSTLSKIKPNRDGSLEFAIRYSYINLNDKNEHGGEQTDINYALNWYISKELKLMFNYIVSKPKGTDNYDGLLQIMQSRLLFAF